MAWSGQSSKSAFLSDVRHDVHVAWILEYQSLFWVLGRLLEVGEERRMHDATASRVRTSGGGDLQCHSAKPSATHGGDQYLERAKGI